MLSAAERLEFSPPPTKGLLRALALALLAHAFLLAALTWGVRWKNDSQLVSVDAELWSALPQEAAPKPVEALPEPVPAPPPVPVVLPPAPPAVDIALEREKLRLKKELEHKKELEQQRLQAQRLKQEKLALEKKRQQEQREKKISEDKAAKRKQAQLEQQKNKELEAQRQTNMKHIAGLAGATGAPAATGAALRSTGPSASYGGRIRARIKPNIVFTDSIATNPQAVVLVRTAPDASIISRELTRSSGNKAWDDAVLKAIDKTQTLPRDTDGRVPAELEISFRPKD